jgi:hypothetical protein
MNISLISEADNALINVSLSSAQARARHGAIFGPHTLIAVNQVLDDAIARGVPVIAITTDDQPGFYLSDSVRLLELTHKPSKAEAEAFGLEFQKTVLNWTSESRQTLLYCNNISEFLRHECIAHWIGKCLATGRSVGLSVLIGSDNPDALQNCPTDVAAQILAFLSFILRSNIEGQFLLDEREGLIPCRIKPCCIEVD